MKIRVLVLITFLLAGLGSSYATDQQSQEQDQVMADLLDVESKYPATLIEGLFYLCRKKIEYFGLTDGKNIDVDFYCSLKVVEFLK